MQTHAMRRIILLVCILTACQSELTQPSSYDYIVFGHYYGMCMGESCVEYYKLTPTDLYENTEDKYPGSSAPYNGQYVLQSHLNFMKVKDLPALIPQELFSEREHIIGMPDAADGGGIYLEVSKNGEQYFWLIDKMDQYLPPYLPAFVDEVEKRISLIE